MSPTSLFSRSPPVIIALVPGTGVDPLGQVGVGVCTVAKVVRAEIVAKFSWVYVNAPLGTRHFINVAEDGFGPILSRQVEENHVLCALDLQNRKEIIDCTRLLKGSRAI